MDFGNLMKNTAEYAVGNIEKAIIEIIDFRSAAVTKESTVSPKGGIASSTGGSSNQKLLNSTLKKLNGKNDTSIYSDRSNRSGKLYYVQFNPNELRLSGYGGGEMPISDFSKEKSNMSYEKVSVRITMEVPLIFDKVNVKDAFMSDKWNTSVSSVQTGAVSAAKSMAGKADYSVQKEVEGFIAALRNANTRRINFYWGDLVYEGVLHRVSSHYTMFNVTGQPVRAEVRLAITCADMDISAASMGRWKQQYYKAFQNQSQSYVQTAQKVGNILNFNM